MLFTEIRARVYNVLSRHGYNLVNMSDWNTVNGIYQSYFKNGYPARVTVQVAGSPRGNGRDRDGGTEAVETIGNNLLKKIDHFSSSFFCGVLPVKPGEGSHLQDSRSGCLQPPEQAHLA